MQSSYSHLWLLIFAPLMQRHLRRAWFKRLVQQIAGSLPKDFYFPMAPGRCNNLPGTVDVLRYAHLGGYGLVRATGDRVLEVNPRYAHMWDMEGCNFNTMLELACYAAVHGADAARKHRKNINTVAMQDPVCGPYLHELKGAHRCWARSGAVAAAARCPLPAAMASAGSPCHE